MKSLAFASFLLILCACAVKRNPYYCEAEDDCADSMYCDIDGSLSGKPNTCIATQECTSSTQCTGDPNLPICDLGLQRCRGCDTPMECEDAGLPGVCLPSGACDDRCTSSTECPDTTPICAEDNGCVACVEGPDGDSDCNMRNSDRPLCSGGACVQCLDNSDCPGQICNTDVGTCMACSEHGQCDSGACLAAQCVAPEMIIYVDSQDPLADDLGECVTDAPCQTISKAIQRVKDMIDARNVIVVRGDVNVIYEGALNMDGISATLIGQGATIRPKAAETNVPVVNIINGGVIEVEGFKITGASAGDNADGIRCAGNTTLSLSRLFVTVNADRGIEITECALTLLRSKISMNAKGGLVLQNSAFTAVNNFIVENGNNFSGLFGGVFISNISAKSPQVFDFNTVARNIAPSAAESNGVECTVASAMTATANIVYEGVGGMATTTGACNWSYSNIQGGDTNNGNISMQPMFVDPNNGDFHLLAESPGVNIQGLSSDTTIDYDGDSRPQGGAFDMGADEVSQ